MRCAISLDIMPLRGTTGHEKYPAITLRSGGKGPQAPGGGWAGIFSLALLASIALSAGCTASPGARAGLGQSADSPGLAVRKRITAAIQSEPATLNASVNPPGSGVPGANELEGLLNVGLAVADHRGALHPRLALEVPSTQNGLWKVFPDGSMETAWRIRPEARWHDGSLFTADDVAFTARVLQDKDLPILRNAAYDSMESVQVPDAATVAVRWTKPFIQADALFNSPLLPKHLLESTYLESKAAFPQLPYWTQDFVGTGPYRLRELVRGSHLILEASALYPMGRPRIDEIEVKFILDASALSASILAGAVELTLGRSLSLDQALELRDHWKEGRIEITSDSWIVMYPQFLNPNPPVVAEPAFRGALLQAVDRQQMAEALQGGLVPVAHAFLSPNQPEFDAAERSSVRYDHDPRRARQTIEELGYAIGTDGAFRSRTGEPLSVEIRASANRDLNVKSILTTADYWQRVGVATETVPMSPQRAQDREYVQTFPGFLLYNQPANIDFLKRIRISQTPLPENNYVGNNNSRYVNREFDGLIERVFVTIPWEDRMQRLGEVVRFMTENVLLLGLFYQAQPAMVANRLLQVSAGRPWNAHQWDIG